MSPAVTATGTTRQRPSWWAYRWRLRLEKSLWLVTVFGRWETRSATEATMEPPDTMSRSQGAKIPDERRASIRQSDGATRGTPYLDRRRKKKRKNFRRERTGSALAPMWVGMSAELGRRGCGGWRSGLERERGRVARHRHPQPLTAFHATVRTAREERFQGRSAPIRKIRP